MSTELSRMRNHWWWRPGWRAGRRVYTFHLTFRDADGTVDGGADLRRLAAEYQARLAGAPPGGACASPSAA